jgi:hypothetical protein
MLLRRISGTFRDRVRVARKSVRMITPGSQIRAKVEVLDRAIVDVVVVAWPGCEMRFQSLEGVSAQRQQAVA